jgi:Tfp pilus assembly protein PilV
MRGPRPGPGDDGVTLLEVLVGTSLMAVVTSVFTAGVVLVYRSVGRAQDSAVAQSQVHVVFQRLDREIRYATAVSDPAKIGADWYVEHLTTANGTALCTQLRLNDATDQLQRRTWTQGASPFAPTAWQVLSSYTTAVGSAAPFQAVRDGDFERLRVRLTTQPPGSTAPGANIDITFTALNTVRGATSADVCAEGRP